MKVKEILAEAKVKSYKDVTFTEKELVKAFSWFLQRLQGLGNKRQDMINYHIKKLVGIPYSRVLQRMPRGPGHGGWEDVIIDTRLELEHMAKKKAAKAAKGK